MEICLGKISDARLYTKGEYPDDADVFVRNVNGELVPMMEWFDHPMSFE